MLANDPTHIQFNAGNENGVEPFKPGSPVKDRLYLRACPRCGGAVLFRRWIDSEYELKCLSCGRSYHGRPPGYVDGVQVSLTEEVRALRGKSLAGPRRTGYKRATRAEVYGLLERAPDITIPELAGLLGVTYRAAAYWMAHYRRRARSGLNRESLPSEQARKRVL